MSAELTQNGVEPPLSVKVRSLLFTIAHNALANAFRHAGASRVLVDLDFGRDELRLSVSDDGARRTPTGTDWSLHAPGTRVRVGTSSLAAARRSWNARALKSTKHPYGVRQRGPSPGRCWQ